MNSTSDFYKTAGHDSSECSCGQNQHEDRRGSESAHEITVKYAQTKSAILP